MTLTIVINDIPQAVLKEAWQIGAEEVKKLFGCEISPTDSITLDFKTMNRFARHSVSQLLAGAITCHVAMNNEG